MSQENVETIRQAFEAYNSGDPSVFLDLYDPEIILCVSPAASTEPGTFVGAERVEQWFQNFFSAFGRTFHIEVLELVEAGDSVVSIHRQTGRGHRSGIEVASPPVTAILTFRGAKVIRIDLPGSREEALAAVGLAP